MGIDREEDADYVDTCRQMAAQGVRGPCSRAYDGWVLDGSAAMAGFSFSLINLPTGKRLHYDYASVLRAATCTFPLRSLSSLSKSGAPDRT